MAQTPMLAPDPVTGRMFIITRYRSVNGHIEALDQTDVTDVFRAAVIWLHDTNRLQPLIRGEL
jgi:hypothetical protein